MTRLTRPVHGYISNRALGNRVMALLWTLAISESFYESSALTRFREQAEGSALAASLIPNWDSRWTPRNWMPR